jgi:rod shape-determining protein MreC
VVVYRQDRRRRLTLVLLVVTSLVLITLDERGSGLFDTARTAAQDAIAPLQRVVDDVVDPVADFFDSLGRADELEAENARLRERNAELETEVERGKAAVAENDRFREVFDIPQIEDYDAIVAQVRTSAVDNFHRTWRIDKGTADGVEVDMPVVVGDNSGAALVGRVLRVARESAVVERIDDRDFSAGAQLVQAGAPGPIGAAVGLPDSSQLSFQLFDSGNTGIEILKDDLVVTAGSEGSRFPRGLPIGRVTRTVPATAAAARNTRLSPIADLDRVDIVKVLHASGASG